MQPNIIYLHSHDTGRYIQPYGHAVPTPNLQRFAEQGVVFRNAFSVAPNCSPSRSALVTGQAPHCNGMNGLAHRGFSLVDITQHILHTLRPQGYHSSLFGVQHVAKQPHLIGYDQVWVESGRAANVVQAVRTFLRDVSQPFYMEIGFFETHREFPDQDDADVTYCRPPAPLPDMPEIRRDMAAFIKSAKILDDAVGVVMQALVETGLVDHTLMFYTTDHGPAFPGMKTTLTNHGIGVPLIVRGPGGFGGPKMIEAPVSHMDIFPTVCDLVGIPAPAWLQGKSLLPLVRGETDVLHEQLFAEVTYHAAYEPMRAVHTPRYKYIKRFDGRTAPVQPNVDDSPSKTVWHDHGWAERPIDAELLYDLIFDPNESNNLVANLRYADVLADMRGRLQRWMTETHDPLLAGAVPLPAGAQANDIDAYTPSGPLFPPLPDLGMEGGAQTNPQ
jgi:arylsulfatase A-like enzyme